MLPVLLFLKMMITCMSVGICAQKGSWLWGISCWTLLTVVTLLALGVSGWPSEEEYMLLTTKLFL